MKPTKRHGFRWLPEVENTSPPSTPPTKPLHPCGSLPRCCFSFCRDTAWAKDTYRGTKKKGSVVADLGDSWENRWPCGAKARVNDWNQTETSGTHRSSDGDCSQSFPRMGRRICTQLAQRQDHIRREHVRPHGQPLAKPHAKATEPKKCELKPPKLGLAAFSSTTVLFKN